MRMKDLPKLERPYEKLENYGVHSLSEAELLAIIIKTGTKDYTAVQIAQELLRKDVEEKGISFLNDISLEEIQKVKGLGRVKALQVMATVELATRISKPSIIKKVRIDTPETASRLLMGELRNQNQEMMKTILMDTQSQVIRIVTNTIGGINSNYIEVRELFKEPIKSSAAKIILVHNHPSGDPTPSNSDIAFTRRINEAADMFGIELVDHIIIGNGVFSSLKRMNKF